MPPQHAFYVTQIPDLDKKKEGMKQAISEVVLFTYRYYKAWFFRNFITVKKIVLIIAIQHFSLLDANYYEMYVILTFFSRSKVQRAFQKETDGESTSSQQVLPSWNPVRRIFSWPGKLRPGREPFKKRQLQSSKNPQKKDPPYILLGARSGSNPNNPMAKKKSLKKMKLIGFHTFYHFFTAKTKSLDKREKRVW